MALLSAAAAVQNLALDAVESLVSDIAEPTPASNGAETTGSPEPKATDAHSAETDDSTYLLGDGESRVGLAPEASMSLEEVWQPLLASALQEFDHRVDLAKHRQLLLQADVTVLIPADRVMKAVQQETQQAATRTSTSHATTELFRDLATIAYDLAAFHSHLGPYTLFEIYTCFSFHDKLCAIQQHASQELLAAVTPPGAGLQARQKSRHNVADTVPRNNEVKETREALSAHDAQLNETTPAATSNDSEALLSNDQAKETSEALSANDAQQSNETTPAATSHDDDHPSNFRELRSRWSPPSPNLLIRYIRAGAHPAIADSAMQNPIALLCEAASTCVREAAQDELSSLVFASDAVDVRVDTSSKPASSSRARRVDEACAKAVSWLCEVAPATILAEDQLLRGPLCILAEAFGLVQGLSPPDLEDSVPKDTLQALCCGLDHCFSNAASHVLMAARRCENLRDSADALASYFKDDAPAPLLRLLDWIEVAMGGAWEVAEQESRLTSRALTDLSVVDVEEIMDSALRLKSYAECVERKVEELKAEEAELKLIEFEARCAKKASQYEERIARLEAEIARRAGSLQAALPLPVSADSENLKQPEKPDGSPKKDEVTEQKSALGGSVKSANLTAKALSHGSDAVQTAQAVVDEIRSDRLVDCELIDDVSPDVRQGLLSMRKSLCAAVERLSTDLYADECHCLWELLQNADDNKYPSDAADEKPQFLISLHTDPVHGAYLLTSNNEQGLTREDVRAICNVNASLKGAGQTGHKGIGWKSVFRITDCPHVLSHAFAFKFDVAGPLGKLALVTPTNLSEEELAALPESVRSAREAGNTVMYLPLRCPRDALAVEAEMRQIALQHLSLIFLRRLDRVFLEFPDSSRICLERWKAEYARLYFPDVSGSGAVKISDFAESGEARRCLLQEYLLHNMDVSLPEKEGSAQLTLAFPASLVHCDDASANNFDDDEPLDMPLQPVFTFLPVRVVGFRFAIQGPFDLTADRSNLHGKSLRNRALCAAIPNAFRAALEKLPGLRSRALDLLGQETPEATWLVVRGQLLDVLKEVECIPTEPDGTLACPRECLLPSEEPRLAEACQQLPAGVLLECCGRRLVRAKWARRHAAQLQGLGLQEITVQHWLEVLQHGDEHQESKNGLAQVAAKKQDCTFFRLVYALLGEAASKEPDVLQKIQTVQLFPDSQGNALRLADGPIFSCYSSHLPKSWQKALEATGTLRILSPAVHAVLDGPAQAFLKTAGVKPPIRGELAPICTAWHLQISDKAAEVTRKAQERRKTESENVSEKQASAIAESGTFSTGGSSSSFSGATACPVADTSALRSALWASLACLRAHFLLGSEGIHAISEKDRRLSWRELGSKGLLVPSSSVRSGAGPCHRLTCPMYLGEDAGSELQQDVLVAITTFVHGVEVAVQDIGVFADAPPAWLCDDDSGSAGQSSVSNKLGWEAFFDALGMRRLSPCSTHRKIAGTVLTIDLGWRLSSSSWWKAVASSEAGFAYLQRRLKEADRVEITWLRQLRTPERVDVSELFFRGVYVRYGGHFLPYMDLAEPSPAMLECLRRLSMAVELTGVGLRKCLRVLEAKEECHDIGVFADVYGALDGLPKEEQEKTGDFGNREASGNARIFVPPGGFLPVEKCIWSDGGRSTLRWLCGISALQGPYGRFGHACRSWLLGVHVGVKPDLQSLEASKFIEALRKLVAEADKANRVPLEERSKPLAGPGSPSAETLLQEMQDVAIQAYKVLAQYARDTEGEEPNRFASVASAFQHDALIVLTDKEWHRPKRLKSHEAFWDVHPDLAESKAAKVALRNCFPTNDEDLLRPFFVHTLGVPATLTREELESRLRVPLRQDPEDQQTAWQAGFGLGDFEEMATIRRGPGVLGTDPDEGGEFFQPMPADPNDPNVDSGIASGALPAGAADTSTHNGINSATASPGSALGSETQQQESARASSSSGLAASGATAHVEQDQEREADENGGSPSINHTPMRPSVPEAPIEVEEEEEDPMYDDWDEAGNKDPYKVLRVERDADDEAIRQAYKKLALKYHPDKNQGSAIASRRFQEIAAAYDILRDPAKRQAYDESCLEDEESRLSQREAEERQREADERFATFENMSAERAQELFQSFFNGQSPTNIAQPTVDSTGSPSLASSSHQQSSYRQGQSNGSSTGYPASSQDQACNSIGQPTPSNTEHTFAPNYWEQPPQRPEPSAPSMPASSSGLEPSQSSCPQTAASSNSQRPRSKTKTKKKKRSQAEYAELLRRLHEAEESSRLWTAEVEAVRQQVKEAEESRDRYLRILQECYDRTTPNAS